MQDVAEVGEQDVAVTAKLLEIDPAVFPAS
jgi:hypothetical protein